MSLNTQRFIGICAVAALMLTWCAEPSAAQGRPRAAAELAAGVLAFPDEDVVRKGMAGGAARFYVSPRVAIGPEVAFIDGENRSHLMLTGNVTFDLVAPDPDRQLTPFLVAGVGLFQTREEFPGSGDFTSTEGSVTAGGGVRALISNNVFVGGEVRVGWETHIRFNGLIGVQW